MPLFTDGPISTLEQLAAQDTAVLDVASTEHIDATIKLSLAQEELGVQLTAALSKTPLGFGSPSVWWPGSPIPAPPVSLQQIVVTPPLRLWHTFQTLALIYRDAYNNQLNDRYLGKWNEYTDLSKWAAEMLVQIGIGIVQVPVPVAQAPVVLAVGGSFQAMTYFAQVAWLNARGEEGLPSAVASVSAPDQNAIQVTAVAPPLNAIAWNVYVGNTIDSIALQNSAALSPGDVWTTSTSGLTRGRAPGTGQDPNFFRPIPRYLQRG